MAGERCGNLIAFWCKEKGRFGKVHTLPLMDGNATKEKILDARKFLSEANVDDYILVFFRGTRLVR